MPTGNYPSLIKEAHRRVRGHRSRLLTRARTGQGQRKGTEGQRAAGAQKGGDSEQRSQVWGNREGTLEEGAQCSRDKPASVSGAGTDVLTDGRTSSNKEGSCKHRPDMLSLD